MDKIIAFDTETDKRKEDKYSRTVLIQTCPITAEDPFDVTLYMGEDCYDQFFKACSECGHDVDVRCFNLSNYEWSRMQRYVIGNCGQWVKLDRKKRQKLQPGQWTCIQDTMKFYSLTICLENGVTVKFTDDMLRLPAGWSMKKIGEQVRKKHPEWWGDTPVKDDWTEYNNGWYYYENKRSEFLTYSIHDAFSQAMIARWMHEQKMDKTLTIASYGIKKAIRSDWEGDNDWKARQAFLKDYPLLNREMQDILEESKEGGYVFGKTGHFKGKFVHLDYSSSYPYEYMYGNMFIGNITREKKPLLRTTPINDKYVFQWYVVSFDFNGLRPHGLPAISAKLCDITYDINKKMTSGHVERKLFTKTYFEELQRHYYVSNIQIHEIWYARRHTGVSPKYIEMCYTGKSEAEKESLERDIWKTLMNGGMHGKTITNTRRKYADYSSGEKVFKEEVNDPQFCALIGFSAMLNARERLIKDCRMLQEHGHEVYANDTDSVIVGGSYEDVKKLFPQLADTHTIKDLGKFEFEKSKYDGEYEFDEIKCWGLKRYCELNKGVFRKSAFAGMHEDAQEELLPTAPTDGTQFEWEQTTSKTGEWGKEIYEGKKHAKGEDIWFDNTVRINKSKHLSKAEAIKLLKEELENIDTQRYE